LGATAGGAVAFVLVVFLLGPTIWRHQFPMRATVPSSNLPASSSNATDTFEQRTIDDIIKSQSGVITQRFDQSR
jgi:hypothetical protein